MTAELYADVMLRWDGLDFQDFVGSKMAVIDIDGGGTATSDAVVLAIEYAPDFEILPHHHFCGHVEMILEGSLRVGDRWERAGDIRIIPANVSYALKAGPEGAKGLEFFPDRRAVLPIVDDPDAPVTGDPAVLRERLRQLLKLG